MKLFRAKNHPANAEPEPAAAPGSYKGAFVVRIKPGMTREALAKAVSEQLDTLREACMFEILHGPQEPGGSLDR
jgi:hypothetical protein